MARQQRALRTRESVVAAAADVFDRLGFERANLAEITQAANVTKGALYFHFATKEELARAVCEEGCELLRRTVAEVDTHGAPALSALMDITIEVAGLLDTDTVIRAAIRLAREGGAPADRPDFYLQWNRVIQRQLRRAERERTLGDDTDLDAVAALLLSATVGAELLARDRAGSLALDPARPQGEAAREGAMTDGERRERIERWLTRIWDMLIPVLLAPGAPPTAWRPLNRPAVRAGATP